MILSFRGESERKRGAQTERVTAAIDLRQKSCGRCVRVVLPKNGGNLRGVAAEGKRWGKELIVALVRKLKGSGFVLCRK